MDTKKQWNILIKNMVELIEQQHGLLIKLTDKEELKDLLKKNKNRGVPIEACDILDAARYLGNGWWDIPPEDIGALTDSPIIGYDCDINDDGQIVLHDDSKIYWYPSYMVKDPWIELLKHNEVFFNLAE